MAIKIEGIYLQSSNEAVTTPTAEDTNTDGQNLSDRHKPKILKTIANCRYAYDNDPTIGGIILNNITTANNQFRIACDDEDVKVYIEQKVKEWDLKNIFTQTLLKIMRDGPCFIEKAIVNSTYEIRFLAFDDDKYKMKVIRDPQSSKIMGFKQKVKIAKEVKNWQSAKYDDLEDEETDLEFNYLPEQIIYPVFLEEDGKAKSLVMRILEATDKKWTLEGFMIAVAHKIGNFVGIKIGEDGVDVDNVPASFVDSLLEALGRPVDKQAAVIPKGVSMDMFGNNTLPDLVTFLKYWRSEIFLALQTPEGMYSTESSNRSTVEVQADDETGYKVFITFLRDILKHYFEKELIDAELTLKKMTDAVGKVKIEFDEEEEVKPLSDDGTAEDINKENNVEEDKGSVPGSTEKPAAAEA